MIEAKNVNDCQNIDAENDNDCYHQTGFELMCISADLDECNAPDMAECALLKRP